MERTILLFFIILNGLGQSFAQTNCDCWEKVFIGQGIDYSAAVKEMEKAFIERGYLKDNKPSSYVLLLDSIIAKNEYYLFGLEFNPILVKKFDSCFMSNVCNDVTYQKIREMNKQLASYHDISPEQTFRDFKTIFRRSGFKKTKVKHYFLTFYNAYFLQLHSGLLGIRGTIENNNEIETHDPIANRSILTVYIAPNDSIYVNDKYVEFQDLRELIIRHKSDTTNFQNSPEIEYIEIEGLGT